MHHIQRKILQRLLYAPALNYAAMRPAGVESNHFAYHLEQLIKDNLVVKEGKLYRLSLTGVAFVDGMSQAKMTRRQQPFIATAIDVTAPNGTTLMFRRNFHPYLGLAGLPMGKLHLDETILAAATRELAEKTGLSGIALRHRGDAYIEGRQGGALISKVLCHIFHADAPEELPATAPPYRGECFWAEHTTLLAAELMPGFLRIKTLLAESPGRFFAEVTEDLGTPEPALH